MQLSHTRPVMSATFDEPNLTERIVRKLTPNGTGAAGQHQGCGESPAQAAEGPGPKRFRVNLPTILLGGQTIAADLGASGVFEDESGHGAPGRRRAVPGGGGGAPRWCG